MTSFDINPIGPFWLVAAIAALLVGSLLVGPSRQRTTGRQRAVLVLLRAAVVMMVLLAMLRPAIVYTELRPQSGSLVLMIDTSRSMQVTDSVGGESRWNVLRKRVADAAELLNGLSKDFDVRSYTFDREVASAPLNSGKMDLPDEPNGPQSAIGASLDDILQREATSRILAVMLLSDGAQRAFAPRDLPPQQPARQLRSQGIPLYTFTFGSSGSQSADLAIDELLAPDTAFAEMPVEIAGQLSVRGYGNQDLKVQLLWETEPGVLTPVDTHLVRADLGADGLAKIPLSFQYTPAGPGEYKVAIQAGPMEGERMEKNNRLSSFIHVRIGGVKVFLLDGGDFIGGGPLPEQRGVRWSLATSPDVTLTREHFDYQERERDFRDAFEPGKYDVILLLNVDSIALNRASWDAATAWIRQGGGLMMAGGAHSFGPGGFRDNSLADALPIEIGRAERQNFGEPPAADMHLSGAVAMRPTRFGRGHWIMDLGTTAEGRLSWEDVPPLVGANRFDPARIKVGANVVAESADEARMPLLVWNAYGNGRVLAFAGDSTEMWRRYGFPEVLKRFWRQVVLWLAKKDVTDEGEVWVRLPQRRILPGEPMTFSVGVNVPKEKSIAESKFSAYLVLPDHSKQAIELTRRGDGIFGEISNLSIAGDYRIAVMATQNGQSLGTAEARFVIEDQDLELDNPAADPDLMDSLAQTTAEFGGEALAPEQFSSLLNQLAAKKLELKETVRHKKTHWDTWPFFLTLVALLAGDWFLRKKWGLV
ncbi:MAG: hypothetical protein JW829_16780 [Pirellulales bacterium]|nr:hypothetical protein [Pirellulales bacterium]